jgi:NTP pyrophosphatase (non-canonical NTP hydrolase)
LKIFPITTIFDEKPSVMTLNEYQAAAARTAVYPENMKTVYPLIGLAGETGEVAEKIKKVLRDHHGVFTPESKEAIAKELGDVLWYLAAIAGDLGFTLDDVARLNLDKIASRKERGRIHGSGDER